MPTIPANVSLNATGSQLLNTIRDNSSQSYQDIVPVATDNVQSVRSIGQIIMTYDSISNEFLSNLVNRIGRVILTSKLYQNPWRKFKKGMLEFGETVEEIFVNIAQPYSYSPSTADATVFKRTIPDVLASFHTMNFQEYYPVTISNDQLRQAFLSYQGIENLIGKIVDSLYTGTNYDEFITMKYLICRLALDNSIACVTIPDPATDIKGAVTTMKQTANDLLFLSDKYNMAGVMNQSDHEKQNIILSTSFDASADVEVMAMAYNLDKAEFIGKRILIDSFSKHDTVRLAKIFEKDANYVPFTTEEITKLATIQSITIDDDFFMVFDNLIKMTEIYNGAGLYWNYFYHTWKTFSASPYACAVLFSTLESAITSVTVTPATKTIAKGSSAQLTATVVATGFAPTGVIWSINSVLSTIDSTGKVTIGASETATSLTATATAKGDSTISGSCAITVS